MVCEMLEYLWFSFDTLYKHGLYGIYVNLRIFQGIFNQLLFAPFERRNF